MDQTKNIEIVKEYMRVRGLESKSLSAVLLDFHMFSKKPIKKKKVSKLIDYGLPIFKLVVFISFIWTGSFMYMQGRQIEGMLIFITAAIWIILNKIDK